MKLENLSKSCIQLEKEVQNQIKFLVCIICPYHIQL